MLVLYAVDWIAAAAVAARAAGNPGIGRASESAWRNRVAREVVNELRMPEAHLDFRRVHVHVHFLVRQIEKKQRHGKHARRHDVAIRLANRVEQQAVAHQAAIHENVDPVAVDALYFGARGEARHANRRRLFVRLRAAAR